MIIRELAREAHENAVKHGWWEYPPEEWEIFALIHAEWSEALEQYRAGKPMVWHDGTKPEGIAVELIDGCMRIMDYMEAERITPEDDVPPVTITKEPWKAPKLVQKLHCLTVDAYRSEYQGRKLKQILSVVFGWMIANGLDPEEIMLEKMAYNATRPYRHGGKVI